MSVEYESNKAGRVLTWRRDYIDYPPHFHETVELIGVEAGSCTACVDFKEYKLEQGDVFIAFPNRIHSYSDENGIFYTFLFPAEIVEPLLSLFETKIPKLPVIRASEKTSTAIDMMKNIFLHNQSKNFYEKLAVKGYFTILLSTVFSKLELEDSPKQDLTAEKRIINYCSKNYKAPLSLEKLSRELFISRHYISHLFSEKLKMGFNDFINQLRVKEACKRIERGESITKAALESGFSSIRTFNRAFMKDMGITPSQYAKNRRS